MKRYREMSDIKFARNKKNKLVIMATLLVTVIMLSMSILPFSFGATHSVTVGGGSRSVVVDVFGQSLQSEASEIESRIYQDLYLGFGEETLGLSISQIKPIQDFADNLYFVVEFVPQGYTIYDSTLEQALEMNVAAQSPWYGLEGDLIYGGATYYYVKPSTQPRSGVLYKHTVLSEELSVTTQEQQVLAEQSVDMYANIAKTMRDNRAITGSPPPEGGGGSGTPKPDQPNTSAESVEIPHRAWQLLSIDTEKDYVTGKYGKGEEWNDGVDGGNCGYVAAAILALYARNVYELENLAPGWPNKSFVKDIQGIMPGPSVGVDVAIALNAYMVRKGYLPTAKSVLVPLLSSIYDLVDSGKPVALFGVYKGAYLNNDNNINNGKDDPNFDGTMLHATTVHRVERERDWYIGNITIKYKNYWMYSHFGWSMPYNNVKVWEGAVVRECAVYMS